MWAFRLWRNEGRIGAHASPRGSEPQKALRHANTTVFRRAHEGPLNASFNPHGQLSQLNVLVPLEHLMSYPIIFERTAAGLLRLSGWWFDIVSGNMFAYKQATRSFEVLDRQEADRLLARFDAEETGQSGRLHHETNNRPG